MSVENNKNIIMAGPCSAENMKQIEESVELIKSQSVGILRASLFKPRTIPRLFEGAGEEGLQWLKVATESGITVATEVLLPDHVSLIRDNIESSDVKKWILWIGSRNQNHLIQRAIANEMKQQGFNTLMIKNQPWQDESHWLGIVDHVLSTGFSSDNLILCHRGFSIPNNPDNFRNVPDFEMSMRVKEKTRLPMIFDPSHVGGSVQKVFQATKEALNFDFDGFIIEVHPNPNEALTDQRQQLNSEEFAEWINLVENRKRVNPEVADR